VSGGPLDGIRVLDLSSVIMGPLATQTLGDLGADVIWVEPPAGDITRVMVAGAHPELSGVALNLHRNKRSVALDLKRAAGRDAVLSILSSCDVLVTNLRPRPLARLGLGYDDLAPDHPQLVFCQGVGYPSDSPRADAPAYDDVIQSASGVADAFALGQGAPNLVPSILADKVCGTVMAQAVLAGLVHRLRTGEGQRVEVPMLDVMQAFMLVEHIGAAATVPPSGPVGHLRILTPHRRPQRTSDGWIDVLPYEAAHWEDVFSAGGREDLVGDARIQDRRLRFLESDFLYAVLGDVLATRTTAEWLAFCEGRGIPATELATLAGIVEGLPVVEHPHAGSYHRVPPAVRYGRSPSTVRRPAPLVGEHGREVLAECGWSARQIDELVASGVLHAPGAVPDRGAPR
jgi:crotonobetainyl-CoA:carnitine CoA-transferase CaiB-like acyl-CoA transferase